MVALGRESIGEVRAFLTENSEHRRQNTGDRSS
jgi:hypothetical protein